MRYSTAFYAFTAIFYGVVSVSITFFNKLVLNTYQFNYPNVILTLQLALTLAVLWAVKNTNLIDYPDFDVQQAKQLLPVGLLYCLNVAVALTSLAKLNIPMYSVLKRLTTGVVLVMENILLGKDASPKIKQAVMIIIIGALIAGASDLTFDIAGYLFALLSCVSQAGYLIYVAKSGAERNLNSFGLLFYNSVLSLPFLLVIITLNDELANSLQHQYLREMDFRFLACVFTAVFLGSILNYSIFLCTTTNSALTTTIVGQLKMAISTLLGMFAFGDVRFDVPLMVAINVVGLCMNTAGGFWYAYLRYQEKEAQQKPTNQGESKNRNTAL